MGAGPQDQRTTAPPKEGKPEHHYDQMNVMAFLMEIQKDISAQSTKIERLIADRNLDNDRLNTSINAISDGLGPIKDSVSRTSNMVIGGFAVGCVALVVISYLIGDDLKALLDFARALPRAQT